MRLLITTDTIGGVWRFAQELVRGLLEAGDSVALVSFGRAASPAQRIECEELANQWGSRFLYVSSEVSLEWMRDNAQSMSEGAEVLRRIATEFGVDLLHSNQFCYGAARLNIPTVVTAHSDVLSWAQACRQGRLEESEWLSRYCALVQNGLDSACAVVTPTEWMLCTLADNYRLPAETAVIANGRSIPALNEKARALRAVTAGRLWDEAKDVALLDGVHSPMPLMLAGEIECDGAFLSALKGVELCGALGEEEMLRLFAASAVYVCTSRYEPFGLAPLEAALSGCALAVRDIRSLREVWGDAALYFGDAGELSEVLKQLATTPALLEAAQRRAAMRAQRYTRRAMTRGYRALYAQLLTKERAYVA